MNAAKLDSLMTLLRTDNCLRETIKANLEGKRELLFESLERVLEEWKSRVTSVASLDALIYVLKHCDLVNSAEALRNKFYIQTTKASLTSSSNEKLSTIGSQNDADFDVEKNKLLGNTKHQPFEVETGNCSTLMRAMKFEDKSFLKTMRQTLHVISIFLFVILLVLGLKVWHKSKVHLS